MQLFYECSYFIVYMPYPRPWREDNVLALTPEWERNLQTLAIILEDVAGGTGVTAIYSDSNGLTIVITKESLAFPLTLHCSAALCTPAMAATIIGRVGLGDFRKLEAVLSVSSEVTIQRGPGKKPQFTASGTLSK
jgi:hypothetical protein